MNRTKRFSVLILLMMIISLAVASPILSSEKPDQLGNANVYLGEGEGRGEGDSVEQPIVEEQQPVEEQPVVEEQQPTEEQPIVDEKSTEEPISQPPQTVISEPELGCQKNNPSRLDCSSLSVSGVCDAGTAVFTITNTGEAGNGDMRAATQYRIIVDGVVVESGSVQLAGGQSMTISYSGGGTVTLEADQQVGHPGNSHPQTTLSCSAPATSTPIPTTEVPPTEEPTTEVPPTEEPTQEVTPTPEPTTEVPPTEEPTQEPTLPPVTSTPTPTPTGPLGCQKNNPTRLDCSSLQVTATCDGDLAVFTIRNTGKAGEGDMRAPTEYRIIVDGVVVYTGTVQLSGSDSMTITYNGEGTVKLEADQQIGHPGACANPAAQFNSPVK